MLVSDTLRYLTRVPCPYSIKLHVFFRLHYGLPKELRIIGDQYVKDEFRRHKNVAREQALLFLKEWTVSMPVCILIHMIHLYFDFHGCSTYYMLIQFLGIAVFR